MGMFDDIPSVGEAPKESGGLFDDIPSAPARKMDALTASTLGIASGLTGNFMDEIEAAAFTPIEMGIQAYQGKPLSISEAYNTGLERARAKFNQAAQEHPWANTAGQVVGALGLGASVGGSALKPGLTLAGRTAPTIMGQGLAGLGEGAAYGTLYGAGAGEGAADRLGKAVTGGLTGAAVGGALGAGTTALAQGGSALYSRIRGKGASRAERMLAADVGADVGDRIEGRMYDLGPQARAYDLGPNTQSRAGGLASTPGKAQTLLRQDVGTRKAGAGARLETATTRALGKPADMLDMAEDIIKRRSEKAGPIYRKAFEQGNRSITSQKLEQLAGSPSMAKAMARAVPKWKDRAITEGYGAANPPVTLTEDGRVVFNRTKAGDMVYPDLRFWDATKRSFDDMIGEAQRSGQRDQVALLTSIKKEMVAELDKAVPNYKVARQVYEGESAIKNAMEDGAAVFTNKMTPGQLKRAMEGMTPAEKEAFTTAARTQVADVMGFARNDALKARQIFDKGYNKEKLAMLVGKQKADELLGNIDSEKVFDTSLDVITRNSETARRQAVQRELGGREGQTMLESIDVTAPGKAVQKVWDKIMGNFRQGGLDKSNTELARLLMEKDSREITKVLNKVRKAVELGEVSMEEARLFNQMLLAPSAQQSGKPLQ